MHVFYSFVFALVQRNRACFTWKGALEIRSSSLLFWLNGTVCRWYCGSDGLAMPTDGCDPGWYCIGGAESARPTDVLQGDQCAAGYFCPKGSAAQLPCTPGMYCLDVGQFLNTLVFTVTGTDQVHLFPFPILSLSLSLFSLPPPPPQHLSSLSIPPLSLSLCFTQRNKFKRARSSFVFWVCMSCQ